MLVNSTGEGKDKEGGGESHWRNGKKQRTSEQKLWNLK